MLTRWAGVGNASRLFSIGKTATMYDIEFIRRVDSQAEALPVEVIQLVADR